MTTNLRQAAQQALEALEWAWGGEPLTGKEMVAIAALRAALAEPEQDAFCDTHCTWLDHHPDCVRAEPEQEPVAMRYDFDGYGYRYIDSGSGSNWQTRHTDAEPLYTRPYDQTALDLCGVCGWRTLIPGDACLNCERVKRVQVGINGLTEAETAASASVKGLVGKPEQPVAHLWQHSETGRTRVVMPDQVITADATWFVVGPLYLGSAPTPQREHITDGSPCWCNPDVIEEDGGSVIVHNYDDNWQQYAKPGETAQQCIERHRSEQDALLKLYATTRKPLSDDQIVDIWAGVSMDYDDQINIIELGRAIESAHGIKGEQHE